MTHSYVRPESIHLAARKVHDAGQEWGQAVHQLTCTMTAANPYGDDALGGSLAQMYQTAGPAALGYITETGFCVVETAAAMERMADLYTVVERDNTDRMRKVLRIVDGLGDR